MYRWVEIKHNTGLLRFLEFDFGSHNRTRLAGLENDMANCYINPLVQALYYVPHLRAAALGHLCDREICLLCELGFLFHMLGQGAAIGGGKTCQARGGRPAQCVSRGVGASGGRGLTSGHPPAAHAHAGEQPAEEPAAGQGGGRARAPRRAHPRRHTPHALNIPPRLSFVSFHSSNDNPAVRSCPRTRTPPARTPTCRSASRRSAASSSNSSRRKRRCARFLSHICAHVLAKRLLPIIFLHVFMPCGISLSRT